MTADDDRRWVDEIMDERRRSDYQAQLADVARLIARADAEAARLRVRRLGLWREARAAGLSWRAIARASGVDHAMVAKVTSERERGRIDV